MESENRQKSIALLQELKRQVENAIDYMEKGPIFESGNYAPSNVIFLGDFIIIDNRPFRDT